MVKFQAHFSKQIKKESVFLLVTSVILSLVTIGVESLTQTFIDGVTTESLKWMGTHLSILIAAYLGVTLLGYFKSYFEKQLNQEGRFEGQVELYQCLLNKKTSFFMHRQKGVLLHEVTNDIYEAMPWLTYGKLLFLLEGLNLLIIIVFMIYMDLKLSLVVIGLTGLSLLLSNRMSRLLGRKNNDKQRANASINHFLLDAVNSIRTIIQLDKRQYFSKQYESYMDEHYQPVIEGVIKGQAFYISQLIFSQEMIPFMVLVVGVILTAFKMTTIGTTIIMMNLTMQISKSVQAIGDILPQKHLSDEILRRIKPLYEDSQANEVINTAANIEVKQNGSFNQEIQNFQVPIRPFESLKVAIPNYRYPETDHVVLSGAYFEMIKGDCVQLQGASGKGKTTLTALISLRLPLDEKALDCEILYNNQPIQSYPIKDYYKHVLQVAQSPLIIEGSLLENLFLGDDFSEEDLNEVIETACLSDFVKENGLTYPIKEKGKNISGGERQRIGLARILLRRPDLLILDEVTSALNPGMREKLVKQVMAYQAKYELTLIVISHNDDFTSYCNKVWNLV